LLNKPIAEKRKIIDLLSNALGLNGEAKPIKRKGTPTLPKPVECEGSDMWPSNPGRVKVSSVRYNKQHAKAANSVYTRPTTSRLVGSLQCASSKIISTGLERDNASICAVSASSVFWRRCCGADRVLESLGNEFRGQPRGDYGQRTRAAAAGTRTEFSLRRQT
jgi:hypothetical protein